MFVLRRTRPDLERPYRTWGYPVVPLLFLLASLGMVVNALVTDLVNTGVTFGIILAGVPVYYAWRGLSGAVVCARMGQAAPIAVQHYLTKRSAVRQGYTWPAPSRPTATPMLEGSAPRGDPQSAQVDSGPGGCQLPDFERKDGAPDAGGAAG